MSPCAFARGSKVIAERCDPGATPAPVRLRAELEPCDTLPGVDIKPIQLAFTEQCRLTVRAQLYQLATKLYCKRFVEGNLPGEDPELISLVAERWRFCLEEAKAIVEVRKMCAAEDDTAYAIIRKKLDDLEREDDREPIDQTKGPHGI